MQAMAAYEAYDRGPGPQRGNGAADLSAEALAKAETPRFDHIGALGHAGWLMSRATEYRHLFINDLEWALMPPLALGQFRIWRQQNMPVAFASWAFLGAPQEKRLQSGIRRLSPADWKSGEALWLIDLVTPFGGRDDVLKELKEKVFVGRAVKMLDFAAAKSNSVRMVEW